MSFYSVLPDLTATMLSKENVHKKFLPIIRQKIFSKKSPIQNEDQFEYSTSCFNKKSEQYVSPSEALSEISMPTEEIQSRQSVHPNVGKSKVSVEPHPKDSTFPIETYAEKLLQLSGAQSEECAVPIKTQSEISMHKKELNRKFRASEAQLDEFLRSIKKQSPLPCENKLTKSFHLNEAKIEQLLCSVDKRIEQLFCSIRVQIEQLKHSIKEQFEHLAHQDLQSIKSVHTKNEQLTSLKKANTECSNNEHPKQGTSFLEYIQAERQAPAIKSNKMETEEFPKHLGIEHDELLNTGFRVSPKYPKVIPLKQSQEYIQGICNDDSSTPCRILDRLGPCIVWSSFEDDTNNFQDSSEKKKLDEESRDSESSDEESLDEIVRNPFYGSLIFVFTILCCLLLLFLKARNFLGDILASFL